MSVTVCTVRSPPEDASLWKVAEATNSCPNALKIIEAIRAAEDIRKLPHSHPGKALSKFWNEVSVETTFKGDVVVVGQKLFIPKSIRHQLLKDLHSTHACSDKMWRTIRGIWVWPAIRNEIKQYVKQCPACAENASSKTHQPPPQLPEEMLVLGPMDRLGVDICHLGNKDLLVMVDIATISG